jgi:ABC-type lipoprotein release transport system permease subunit
VGISRVLTSVLYEVTPHDPVTFVSISLFLGAVTLAACLIPARRAVEMDPVEALRAD